MGRAPTNSKQKLLDTAKELIWKNSYGSVSVDDICKNADVKKGSFYYYFKTKADLAVATMEDYYQNSKPLYDEIFSPSVEPVERFGLLVKTIIKSQRETLEEYGHVCGCPFATLGSEMAGQEELIRTKTNEIFGRYARYYESTLRELVQDGLLPESIDIKSKASEIYSYMLGQVLVARIQNSLEGLERDLGDGLMRLLNLEGAAT